MLLCHSTSTPSYYFIVDIELVVGPMHLKDQTAIITGSGRGIGRAIAEEFAVQGANVTVTARSRDEIADTAESINENTPGDAISVAADVSDFSDVDRVIEETAVAFGGLDILVNNAAILNTFDVQSDPMEDFERTCRINLDGAAYFALEAAKEIASEADEEITGKAGRIVNISSVHSQFAEAGSFPYDVSKGGLDAMTRSLAVQLAPFDILVNGIAPGFVDTAMSVVDGENELESDEFVDYYIGRRKIPQARAGDPEEIARVARFLASSENTYMTGQTLFVDGGLSVTF